MRYNHVRNCACPRKFGSASQARHEGFLRGIFGFASSPQRAPAKL